MNLEPLNVYIFVVENKTKILRKIIVLPCFFSILNQDEFTKEKNTCNIKPFFLKKQMHQNVVILHLKQENMPTGSENNVNLKFIYLWVNLLLN